MTSLLISLLIICLILGLVVWIAQQFLPHPFKAIVIVVAVVILLIWLLHRFGGALAWV